MSISEEIPRFENWLESHGAEPAGIQPLSPRSIVELTYFPSLPDSVGSAKVAPPPSYPTRGVWFVASGTRLSLSYGLTNYVYQRTLSQGRPGFAPDMESSYVHALFALFLSDSYISEASGSLRRSQTLLEALRTRPERIGFLNYASLFKDSDPYVATDKGKLLMNTAILWALGGQKMREHYRELDIVATFSECFEQITPTSTMSQVTALLTANLVDAGVPEIEIQRFVLTPKGF